MEFLFFFATFDFNFERSYFACKFFEIVRLPFKFGRLLNLSYFNLRRVNSNLFSNFKEL